jgi:hypothetical protein
LIPAENFKQVMKDTRVLLMPVMHLEQKEEGHHQLLHGTIEMSFSKD